MRVVLLATGARSGASASGSERPGRPIGARRAPGRRGAMRRVAGASRSTPVLSQPPSLEDQRLVLHQAAAAGEESGVLAPNGVGGPGRAARRVHASCRAPLAGQRSTKARAIVVRCWSRWRRPAGRRPGRPRAEGARRARRRGCRRRPASRPAARGIPGTRIANSLKKRVVSTSTPGTLASAIRQLHARWRG